MKKGNYTKTILITDAGGRGAALVDKYGQSKYVGKIFVVPGNDLMQINTDKKVTAFSQLKTTSVNEILQIVQKEKVDLVDVAQDNAVEVGLVDELLKKGVPVFGPTRAAGQIEWDKAWARDFMEKYDIPSPSFHRFRSEEEGINFAKKNPGKKWFIKASGLAEGKGAIAGADINETIAAIKEMKKFGTSGETYLLEEWLMGEEFSAFALCDGESFKVVGYAQDHKRVNDGDMGPNTGGMGCVSNPLVAGENIRHQVSVILKKTIDGLEKEERPYKGVLYLGGIVVTPPRHSERSEESKVFVIEFNARWGDPEAEVLVPAINNDLYELTQALISGKLNEINLEIDEKVRVAVAAVSKGYPVDYSVVKGKKVSGIDEVQKLGVKVYGAGIKRVDNNWVVNGGRVLYLVGEGENIIEAREKAYKAMELISVEGDNLHYRTDIGWRDLERLKR